MVAPKSTLLLVLSSYYKKKTKALDVEPACSSAEVWLLTDKLAINNLVLFIILFFNRSALHYEIINKYLVHSWIQQNNLLYSKA